MICELAEFQSGTVIVLHSVDKVFFENDCYKLFKTPREAYLHKLTRMAELVIDGWDLITYSSRVDPIFEGWLFNECNSRPYY